MKFQTTFAVLLSLAVAALGSTIVEVKADMANIATQVTNMDNAIKAFPNTGGTAAQALAIHTAAMNLGTTLDQGTKDVMAVPHPVAEADAQAIFKVVQAFKPTILEALKVIVTKKPAFEALPIGGVKNVVSTDLKNLSKSASPFGSALIAASPPDVAPGATTLKADVDGGFANAIAAYN